MAKVAMVSALDGTTEAIKTATYKEFAKARAYLPGQKKKKAEPKITAHWELCRSDGKMNRAEDL